jgi:hypothetical protein
MSFPPVLLAAQWQEQLEEIHDQVPEYLGKIGVPVLEKSERPPLNIVTDVAIVLGAIALLIALWRLLTLRIFRFLFGVIAALLIAYYPVAYGFHWWLFEYDREAKAARDEMPAWEDKIHKNLKLIDYGILGGGVLIGGTLLYLSRRKHADEETEEQRYPDSGEQAPWHQQAAERQRPQGKSKSEKNPFDFS